MTEGKQTVGPAILKRYKCTNCDHIELFTTNHYGDIYNTRCPNCFWKGGYLRTFECLEPLPEGWAKPEPWKKVKLSDICEVI
jgi:hypothetical protein